MPESFLSIRGVRKDFGNVTVVQEFDLEVPKGEFVSFLGPSGCGKTTMLRIVAGFESPSAGNIGIAGKDVTGLKPNQRNIGMVFQAYALFPNLTVVQNIGFGLKVAGMDKAQADARIAEMLDLIKLKDFAGRYPYQLSGGQQQRVALARALAPKPRLLLLDEPLSALDAKVRVSLREEIRAIQRELGVTTIFVTHDQEEAMSMSDRIVVMNSGRAEQVGTPYEIYNRPSTRFVASFVGTLSMLEGRIADAAKGIVSAAGARIEGVRLPANLRKGDRVTIALRPEALRLNGRKGDATLSGRIADVDFLGSVIRMKIAAGDSHLSVDAFNDPSAPPPAAGKPVTVHFSKASVMALPD